MSCTKATGGPGLGLQAPKLRRRASGHTVRPGSRLPVPSHGHGHRDRDRDGPVGAQVSGWLPTGRPRPGVEPHPYWLGSLSSLPQSAASAPKSRLG